MEGAAITQLASLRGRDHLNCDVSPVALGQMVRANAVSFHMSKETSPLRRV